MAGNSEPIIDEVIRTVAAYTGNDPRELPPLITAIDPDVLETLFGTEADEVGTPPRRTLIFGYAGCSVRIDSAGCITVTERQQFPQSGPLCN